MKVTIEAQSDVGRVRELNEDSFRVVPERNTIIVCDGMGGHAAGEVASATAAETISELMRSKPAEIAETIFPKLDRPVPHDAVMLAGAVRVANRRVYNTATKSHKLRGMGTTVVAAVFVDGAIATAHVGDSRAYRIANGAIEQLTTDHSWISELVQSGQVKPEDAENFADKNVITRALGTRPNVQVDVGVFPTKAGELYLLCSDGLCGYVSDQDILKIVLQYRDDLSAAAAGLIAAANEAGGLDNCTVALVRVDKDGSTNQKHGVGTLTVPEESDPELDVLDRLISERYPEAKQHEDTDASKADTGPIPIQRSRVARAENEEVLETGGSGVRWGWVIAFVIVIAIGGLYFFGKAPSTPVDEAASDTVPQAAEVEEAPAASPAPVERPKAPEPKPREPAPVVTSSGVINVVAFDDARNAGVYWDGEYKGRVSELEMGMSVGAGEHHLVVMTKAGDTLMKESVTVHPDDTLDFEVK
jgi:protein phosphatase